MKRKKEQEVRNLKDERDEEGKKPVVDKKETGEIQRRQAELLPLQLIPKKKKNKKKKNKKKKNKKKKNKKKKNKKKKNKTMEVVASFVRAFV
ncbi:hypothetical protein Pmani_029309 [Petrolisthes manimaculis]|uniref:Uncharacterized protein n=1 Tax=Petrolisthes manimaculis TaxID=1843537 RepID=A0AAE1TX41_9EUCA|nr:hypothetical protein Pmani_029309 [Petrolisthes manimaculis]